MSKSQKLLIITVIATVIINQDIVAQGNNVLLDQAKYTLYGFGDLVIATNPGESRKAFELNQFELDLDAALVPDLTLTFAAALDDGDMVLAQAVAEYVAYRATDSSSSPLRPTEILIGGGQFDVIFGIDHQCYASVDRKLISCPMVVESTHQQWNDQGLYLQARAPLWDITLYGVNGFENLPLSDASETLTPVFSSGINLGISPIDGLRVGGSIAFSSYENGPDQIDIWGIDFAYQTGPVELAAEYIAHDLVNSDLTELNSDGYYARAVYNLDNWSFVTRYGEFSAPDESGSVATRWSSGVGRSLSEQVVLRGELQINNQEENAVLMQLAIGF